MNKITTYLVHNPQSELYKKYTRYCSLYKIPYKDYSVLPQTQKQEVTMRVQQVNFGNTIAICEITDRIERINTFTDNNSAINHTIALSIKPTPYEQVILPEIPV